MINVNVLEVLGWLIGVGLMGAAAVFAVRLRPRRPRRRGRRNWW